MIIRFAWIVVLMIFLGGTSCVVAQVFTLDLPSNPLNQGFNHQVGLNGNFQGGNTLLSDLTGTYRMDYLASANRTTVELNYEYGTQGNGLYADNGLSLIRYVQPLNKVFGVECVLSRQYDVIQLIDNRVQVGGGVRIKLFGPQNSQVTTNATLGVGVLGESQTLALQSATQTLRGIMYVSWLWAITPTITFNATLRSLPNLGWFFDNREDFLGQLTIQLTDKLSLTMQLTLKYNSLPAGGVQSLDTQYTNGLTWSF